MKKVCSIIFLWASFVMIDAYGQEEKKDEIDHSYKPLIVELDPSGRKYIRFITWHQIWGEDGDLSNDDQGFSMRIRRSRLLAYAQISPRFLILTHFGLNSLTSATADPIGNRATNDNTINSAQIFLHAAWTEFKVTSDESLYMGGGLHYWNGLSRLTSASTLNFMTLDNYRQAWASLGLTDQFARHLGIYAKGRLGKLNYTVAINDPISNALGSSDTPEPNTITYSGRRLLGNDAATVIEGYFDYQFFDQESNKLPYRVGTYMGTKRVFNIGAGFYSHANGTVSVDNAGNISGNDVNHFAIDAYYDAPLGQGALNGYAAYYNFNYGDNYTLGYTYGTGSSIYAQGGYLLPKFSEKVRFMPYLAYSTRDFEAYENAGNTLQIGLNSFLNGHNAKITLEYNSTLYNYSGDKPDRVNGLILQTQIFL